MDPRQIRQILLLLISTALVMGISMRTNTAEASTVERVMPMRPPPSEPCLALAYTMIVALEANSASMRVMLENNCPFYVNNVSVYVEAENTCPGTGTGDAEQWVDYTADGGIIGAYGWETLVPITFFAHCIECLDGETIFPPFSVVFMVDQMRAQSFDQAEIPVTNAPENVVTTTVPMANDAGDAGGFVCP